MPWYPSECKREQVRHNVLKNSARLQTNEMNATVWAKLNLSGCIKLLHISLSGSMAKHVQLSSFVS